MARMDDADCDCISYVVPSRTSVYTAKLELRDFGLINSQLPCFFIIHNNHASHSPAEEIPRNISR